MHRSFDASGTAQIVHENLSTAFALAGALPDFLPLMCKRGRGGSTHAGMDKMLLKRRCPHTGIVNFFLKTDPYLAVGSVRQAGPSEYVWRCYAEPFAGAGSVEDMKTAERSITELCRKAERSDCAPFVDAA